MEESPSPKTNKTWVGDNQRDCNAVPPLTFRLHNWFYKTLNSSCGPASTLSKILGTLIPLTPIRCDNFEPSLQSTLDRTLGKIGSLSNYADQDPKTSSGGRSIFAGDDAVSVDSRDLEFAIKKISLASTLSLKMISSILLHC